MHQLLGAPFVTTLKDQGILTPVRALDLEFLAPVTWDQQLIQEVSITEIGQHSFTFRVAGFLAVDRLAYKATITYVTLSAETQQKTQVPDQLVALLNHIKCSATP
jgi:acyl-CoA thioesterase FadM